MRKLFVLVFLLLSSLSASASGVDVASAVGHVMEVLAAVGLVATACLMVHSLLVGLKFMKREIGSYRAGVAAAASMAAEDRAIEARWQAEQDRSDDAWVAQMMDAHNRRADDLAAARMVAAHNQRADDLAAARMFAAHNKGVEDRMLGDALRARGMSESAVSRALEIRSAAMRRAGG